jgi:hypothetical protein
MVAVCLGWSLGLHPAVPGYFSEVDAGVIVVVPQFSIKGWQPKRDGEMRGVCRLGIKPDRCDPQPLRRLKVSVFDAFNVKTPWVLPMRANRLKG